jgi:hypothetical protein
MSSKQWATRVAATAVGVLALSCVQAGQAGASAWPNDTWTVNDELLTGYSTGSVTWGNRSATLRGNVVDKFPSYSTTVFFTAYAGAQKVDSDTRTASPGEDRSFGPLVLEAPNLVGGFDRVKIQVCPSQDLTWCSPPVNLDRDSVAEHGFYYPG